MYSFIYLTNSNAYRLEGLSNGFYFVKIYTKSNNIAFSVLFNLTLFKFAVELSFDCMLLPVNILSKTHPAL